MQRYIRFILCQMILLTLFARPTPVFACSCVIPDSPPIEVGQADAVFQGRVLSIVDKQNAVASLLNRVRNWIGLSYYYNPRFYGYRVTFNVSSSWKGVTATVTEVTTGYGGGDCGYLFKVGADYVVYAYGHANDLAVSICSRTAELSSASSDLSYLNTLPRLPLTPVSPTPWLLITTVVLIVVTLVAVAIFWFLRQRRGDKL